ncbi:MAG: hypothetical protein ABR543_08640 [Gemmatimonadaceae bacterium]
MTGPASAQVPRDTARAPRDSAPAVRDTLTVADSSALPKPDTIEAPFTRSPSPPDMGIGEPYRWDRESLFASGALTLLDLLEHVPGLTGFRSGSIASPMFGAFLGDIGRVRVFYDGLEMATLDHRTGGLLDLGEVQLWTLEQVAIERGADELRIFLRSWRVVRNSPYTRTDVMTGDLETNVYRGFFGRRFQNGLGLQLAGQQYGYGESGLRSSDAGGDQLALVARLGWARGIWSVDGYAIRATRTRDRQEREQGNGDFIARLRATRTDAYLRAGVGDPERGAWLQALAANADFTEKTPFTPPRDSADTTRSETQFVASAGFTRWGFRLSAEDRVLSRSGTTRSAISGRASLDRRLLGVSLYAEYGTGGSTSSEEAQLRLTPLSFLSLAGAVARRHGGANDSGRDVLSSRGEVAVRVGRAWLSGGVLVREGDSLPAPRVYDSTYVNALSGKGTGNFVAIRGKVWNDIGLDGFAVRWSEESFYRPRTQSRAEIFINTKWLRRFPKGNFGFLGSMAHEYRSATPFPRAVADGSPVAAEFSTHSHALISRMEITILDAVIFWQQRFWLAPRGQADIVPGFVFPQQFNLYGVRWTFWN